MIKKVIANFKNRNNLIELIVLFLIIISLGYALYADLGREYSQPTADLWINRGYRFFLNFKSKDYIDTYVFYHPGVTITWIVGAVVYYFPKYLQYKYGYVTDLFDEKIFPEFNFIALVPIVSVILISLIVSYFLIRKMAGRKVALIFLFLSCFEPFFIGNARSIHMDAFVTIFGFICLLSLNLYLFMGRKLVYLVISSLFFSLGFLTRSNTFILLPFVFLLVVSSGLLEARHLNKAFIKRTFLDFIAFFVCAYLFMIVMWPALWVDQFAPVKKLLEEGVLYTGLADKTKSQLMYFWDLSNDSLITKILHYPIQFVLRTNGFLILLLSICVLLFVKKIKPIILGYKNFKIRPDEHFMVISVLFIIYYLFIISVPDKYIFRYVLPITPFVIYFVSYQVKSILISRSSYLKSIVIILLVFTAVEAMRFYPNTLVYYNSLLGGISTSANLINTDQAGAGLAKIAYELNNLDDTGGTSVAVYDSVPFGAYYAGVSRPLKSYDPLTNPVDTDYVIVGVQKDNKFFDTADDDYALYKKYKYGGQVQWTVYKKK